jgi:glycine oxidase
MQTNYLIVGQGLAGTLLAHLLLEQGKNVQVYDAGHQEAASLVAAGAINPVTGRRIVKSWMIDELLPEAQAQYQRLEQLLGISIYHERNINWVFSTPKEENEFNLRSALPGITPYVEANVDASEWQPVVRKAYSFGELTQTAQVDLPLLITTFRQYLKEKNILIEENIDGVKFLDKYKNSNTKIIFCEGEKARFNPLWADYPFVVAKGEVLLIRFEEKYSFSKILKDNISIIPLNNTLYWVGSNYEWTPPHPYPTEAGKNYLLEELQKLITIPFEVVAHQAAIRPSTKDRRPFVGVHPEHPNCFILNGLGTKGTSLAPYWARYLVEMMS